MKTVSLVMFYNTLFCNFQSNLKTKMLHERGAHLLMHIFCFSFPMSVSCLSLQSYWRWTVWRHSGKRVLQWSWCQVSDLPGGKIQDSTFKWHLFNKSLYKCIITPSIYETLVIPSWTTSHDEPLLIAILSQGFPG